jgi:hypothetical protein
MESPGITGGKMKAKKAFTDADILKLVAELRAHGFGELSAQVVEGKIIRMRKMTTHEATDN